MTVPMAVLIRRLSDALHEACEQRDALLAACKALRDGDEDRPEYHAQGMGCGVEDRCLQSDPYAAAEYGWERALERMQGWIDNTTAAAIAAAESEGA